MESERQGEQLSASVEVDSTSGDPQHEPLVPWPPMTTHVTESSAPWRLPFQSGCSWQSLQHQHRVVTVVSGTPVRSQVKMAACRRVACTYSDYSHQLIIRTMTSGFNDLKSCEGDDTFLELFVLVVIVQKSRTDLVCVWRGEE